MFFSLAVGGQTGVQKMLGIIRDELEAAMALCGCKVPTKLEVEASYYIVVVIGVGRRTLL